ncbi:MAG: YslB family protein [Sporolactobacillus sp.]
MEKKDNIPKPEQFGEAVIPAFGYELIRSVLLPELLGKETATILYWSGRKLARLYPLTTEQDIPAFFERAGWGRLSMTGRGKRSLEFECESPIIETRIKDHPDHALFTLEAGFIAQQIQQINGCIAEAFSEVRGGRQRKVIFRIEWDPKDAVR